MTPARIHLVRHATVDAAGRCFGQRLDPGLTVAGRDEAERLRARLPHPIGRVVTSPARRARETAAILGGDLVVDARWSERDFGAWEGRPWEKLWAQAAHAHSDTAAWAAFTPPDAETTDQVAHRVSLALADVTDQPAEPPTVVVTHGGPLRLVLAQILGLDITQAFAFVPACATITTIVGWDSQWTVERVGA